jgi:hypothetical protein
MQCLGVVLCIISHLSEFRIVLGNTYCVGLLGLVSAHCGLVIAHASCHRLDTGDVPVLVVSFCRQ